MTSRVLRRARIGTTLTFTLAAALSAVWIVRVPALVDKLHLQESTVGVVVLCWGAGALLTMQLTRRLMVRVGTRTPLRFAGPASAVTLVLIGIAPNFTFLLVAATTFGMAFGILDIAMNTQAAAIERAYDKHLMNGMHAGWSLGAVIGGGLGALTAAAGWSFTETIIGAAAIMAPASLALGPTYLSEADERHDAEIEVGREPAGGRLPAVVYLIGAIAFCAFMVEGSVADWSGLYLNNYLSSTQAIAALGYPAFEVGTLAGRLVGDRIRSALGTRALLTTSGVAIVGSFVIVLLAGAPWVGLLGFFAVGLASCTVVPLAFSLAGDVDPPRAASAIAVAGTLGYAGLLLGPVAIGALSRVTSLHTALWVAAVLGIVIAVAGRALPRQWRVRSHDDETAAVAPGGQDTTMATR